MRLSTTLGVASVLAMTLTGAAYASVSQTATAPISSEAPKAAPAPVADGEKVAVNTNPEAKVGENPVGGVQVPGKKQKRLTAKAIEEESRKQIIRDPFDALQNPAISFTTAGTFATGRAGGR